MSANLNWLTGPKSPLTTTFQDFLRDFDWSATDLGPIDSWPVELRHAVRFMGMDSQPTIIYWGPSRSIIYNEAHVPLVGDKHPNMMGRRALDVFPDFWQFFEITMREQEETGRTASGEASRLLMERHGFLEETYFDWKLVPIISEDGKYLGGYGTPSDKTKVVINERRALCVQNLTHRIGDSSTFDELWKSAIDGFLENDKDIPFALLYANDGLPNVGTVKSTFSLVGSIGVPNDHELKNTLIDLDGVDEGFSSAVRVAIEQSRPFSIQADDPSIRDYMDGIQWQGSGTPCHQFVVVPIMAGSKISVVMVIGTNPHRMYNRYYQDFVRLLSEVLASQVSKLRLSEELDYRAAVASKATKDFQQSETRFLRLASRSSVGITVTDLEGRVLYANEAWANFCGIDPEQVKNFNWRSSVYEEDLPLIEQWWYNVTVLKQSGTFQFRSKYPFKSGNMELPHRTGLCACYADIDKEDGVETVMGLVVDISEQKWIEGQLLQRTREMESSEERYRTLADLSPLGIVSTDRNGYIQFGNDAWHDFYGFKKGEVKEAQPWLAYVAEEHLEKTKQYFVDLQTKKGPLTIELRLNRTFTIVEGDKLLENSIWVLATGVQEYSADGQIDHIDFWVTDISAQKMAAKLLNDKMEEAIRTRNQQERFIDMISHEIRNPLSAVLHCGEEIIESVKQYLERLQQTNGISNSNATRNNASTTELANAIDAANTIMYCVQHQKQIVDDVLTLSKLDSDLLVVSPVAIRLSDLMQSAARIFTAELRMSDIELQIKQDESLAKYAVEWLLLDPNRFLQIVINLLTNAIKFTRGCEQRKIEVTTSVHLEPPRQLREMDFVPRKFSPLERRGSYVQAGSSEDASQLYLLVDVSDTGKGLSEQEKKLLFKRFAQASPKTSVEYGGSGLGLFISRQITEMLGGEIGVGNSPSGGCNFAFYIATSKIDAPEPSVSMPTPPLRPASAPVPIDPSKETRSQLPEVVNGVKKPVQVAPGIRRVLVVEDNLVNQRVLCKQLRNRGFDVEAANHGREALMALEIAALTDKNYFDVILCDIEMPVMDGIQTVQEVRKREANGNLPAHVPIIGVTANVRSKHVDAAMEAGMDGITTKPYRIDDLILHIDRLCANANLVT